MATPPCIANMLKLIGIEIFCVYLFGLKQQNTGSQIQNLREEKKSVGMVFIIIAERRGIQNLKAIRVQVIVMRIESNCKREILHYANNNYIVQRQISVCF